MGQLAFGTILRPGTVPIIPGAYTRITSSQSIPLGLSGLVGIVARANFGDINSPKLCYSVDDTVRYFGANNGFAPLVAQVLSGGAIGAYCSRAGTGGTAASLVLQTVVPAPAVTLTAKSPGTRAFSVTLRASTTQPGTFELITYESGVPLEVRNYGSTNQAAALVAAVNNPLTGSSYFNAVLTGTGTDVPVLITQVAPTVGTNPTVDATATAAARVALRSVPWFVLIQDSEDPVEHLAMAGFLDQCILDGLRRVGFGGQDIASVTLDTMISGIASINDPAFGYVVNDFQTAGGRIAGMQAAARVAGILSTMQVNQTMSARSLPDATLIPHDFVNSDMIKATNGGAMFFMRDHRNRVITSKGATTLVNPALPPAWAENLDTPWNRWGRVVRVFGVVDDLMITLLDRLSAPDVNSRPHQNAIGLLDLTVTGQGVLNKYMPDTLDPSTTFLLDPSVAQVSGQYAFKIDPFRDISGVDTVIVKLNTSQAT